MRSTPARQSSTVRTSLARIAHFPLAPEVPPEGLELADHDSSPHARRQVLEIGDVVPGEQHGREILAAAEEMVELGL